MPIRYSSSGGTPFGDTANRPSSPQVGQTYYNGQLGYLEIYTASGWIPATGANDFSLNITGTNTTVTFSQTYSSGSYSIVSFLNDATLDIYAYATDGSLVGYTNTKAFNATQRFNKMVVLGGSTGDVLQFSYKTTYATSPSTTDITAGPYITSITPSSMPNINSTVTITGGNFATDVAVAFTGTGYSSTAAKSIVRSSATQLIVTRPDNFPTSGSPYTITVTNPSVAYQPTGSAANTISVTAGVNPVWVTAASQSLTTGFPMTALSATDADGGSSVTYSIISGSIPTGSSFNTSTGAFTGVPTTPGTYNFTVRATDSGGNIADRAFTYVLSGGTVTSDATYYYQSITSNQTLTLPQSITADILLVAGGGGGAGAAGNQGLAGGGGAGGYISLTNQSLSTTPYVLTVGGGGTGVNGSSNIYTSAGVNNGVNTTGFGQTCIGGGVGSHWWYGNANGVSTRPPTGGSGGGGGNNSTGQPGGLGTSGQGNNGGSGAAYSGSPGATSGGGGGGAGAVGGNGSGATGGNGGIGLQWLNGTYYAGGGGGSGTTTPGSGGNGGGGAGAKGDNAPGTPGTAYTGGGGGAAGDAGGGSAQGGNGGSGVIVLRYTRAQVGG